MLRRRQSKADGDAREAAAPQGAPTRVRRLGGLVTRHGRGLSTLSIAAGLFASGIAAGWALWGDADARDSDISVVVDRPVAALVETDAATAAPNVLGLDEETARRVFFDAGVAPDAVEVATVPSAGEPGLVVLQEPPPGIPVVDGVRIRIAEPTTVPELVGLPIKEARQTLEDRGARVRVRSIYVPASPEGTVVATEPSAGESLKVDVTVTVAGAPSSVFLADLRAVESSCSTNSATVNGDDLPNSLLCDPTPANSQPRQAVYLLKRLVDAFEATLGQSDTDSAPGAITRTIIRADDRVVFDGTFAYGESKPISVDVTNTLRLSIETHLLSKPEGVGAPTVVIGSARLVGGRDEIERLTGEVD